MIQKYCKDCKYFKFNGRINRNFNTPNYECVCTHPKGNWTVLLNKHEINNHIVPPSCPLKS